MQRTSQRPRRRRRLTSWGQPVCAQPAPLTKACTHVAQLLMVLVHVESPFPVFAIFAQYCYYFSDAVASTVKVAVALLHCTVSKLEVSAAGTLQAPADGDQAAAQPAAGELATAGEPAGDPAAAATEPAVETAADTKAALADTVELAAGPAPDAEGAEGASLGAEENGTADGDAETAAAEAAAPAQGAGAAGDADAAPALGGAGAGKGVADVPVRIGYRTFASGNEASAYYNGIVQNITRNQDLNEVCTPDC